MTGKARALLWGAGAPVRLAEVLLIRLYRVALSGLLGGRCRFHPTCSAYAEQAVREVGAVRGSLLAAWRVLRCSPLSAGGVDYPPRRWAVYDSAIHSGARPLASLREEGLGG